MYDLQYFYYNLGKLIDYTFILNINGYFNINFILAYQVCCLEKFLGVMQQIQNTIYIYDFSSIFTNHNFWGAIQLFIK